MKNLCKNEGKIKGTPLDNFNKNLNVTNPFFIQFVPGLETTYSLSPHLMPQVGSETLSETVYA